jgi:hypothetical protein
MSLGSGGPREERLDCSHVLWFSRTLHANLVKLCGQRGYAVAKHANDQKESKSASIAGFS